jgi:hypothetical protein
MGGKSAAASPASLFRLGGTLVYNSSRNAGHYSSLARECTPPFRWLQFNDDRVRLLDPAEIPDHAVSLEDLIGEEQ